MYKDTFEMINHGVLWIAEDGRILGHNQRMADDLGYRDGFKPNSIFEVNPHLNFLTWRKMWQELSESGKLDMQTQHISAAGTLYTVGMKALLMEENREKVCCAFIDSPHSDKRTRRLLELTSSVTHAGSWQYDVIKDDWIFTDEVFVLLNIPRLENYNKASFFEQLKEVMLHKDYDILLEKFNKNLAKGASFSHEFALKNAVERKVEIRMTGIPEQEDGSTLAIYGLVQEVGKTFSVADADKNTLLSKFAMDKAKGMIFWMDAAGYIKYVNDAVLQRTKYNRVELEDKHIEILNEEWDKKKWSEFIPKIREEKQVTFKTTHRSKNGEVYPVEIEGTYLMFEGVEYLLANVRDIESKNNEELRLKLYRDTVKASPIMISWVDKSGRVFHSNQALRDTFGYTTEELKGMHVNEFSPKDMTDEEWAEMWEHYKNSSDEDTQDGEALTKDGTLIPIEVKSKYITYEDKEFLCFYSNDISKRKEAEEDLKTSLQDNILLNDRLRGENQMLRTDVKLTSGVNNIITQNAKYRNVLHQLQQVADTEATVLITGETGTGKELLAKSVHTLSRRADKPMISVNCAALPENLFESELFGHERGAFTGAHQQKRGRFELADGGTIFLDEIGEMPLNLQAKLLRVLQEGTFERIGGTKTISTDVRVVVATNRDLEAMVEDGKFREDLYYRLNVFPIHNLPLRDRKDDIPLLVEHFLRKFTKKVGREVKEISKTGMKRLMAYDFPGNVRELENMVERALIVSTGKVLELDRVVALEEKKQKTKSSKQFKSMEDATRDHIIAALERTNWRISGKDGAAKLLQINGKTLYSRMSKLGIKKK